MRGMKKRNGSAYMSSRKRGGKGHPPRGRFGVRGGKRK